MELINSVATDASSSSATKVKAEPKTLSDEELKKKKIEEFVMMAPRVLRKFQDFVLEQRGWHAQACEIQYAEGLASDLEKHIDKSQKVLKLLEAVAVGSKYNEA